MSDKISYSRVTVEQLIVMINFMGQHADFATGNLRTMEARMASKKLWAKFAKLINSCKTGIKKSPVGWSRYWSDYKNKIKKKLRLMQKSQQKLHPNSSSSIKPFTNLEKRALVILGPDFGKPSAEPVDSLIDYQDDFSSSVKMESLHEETSNGSSRVMSEPLNNNSEGESEASNDEDVYEVNEDSGIQTSKVSNKIAEMYPNWLVKVEKKRAAAELLRAKAEKRRSKVAAKNAEAAMLQAESLNKLSEAAKVQAEAIVKIANCLEKKLSGTELLSI